MHIYSFFPFLSTYFLVLFSSLYSPLGTLLYVCSPLCALDSFVLVDIIFDFLCSLGLSIVLYFCWIALICLWVYMYMCIFSHTFYCCYKPLPLCWGFAVLWSFSFFFLLPFFFLFFFIILSFRFLKAIIFFLHLFLCLPFPIVTFLLTGKYNL